MSDRTEVAREVVDGDPELRAKIAAIRESNPWLATLATRTIDACELADKLMGVQPPVPPGGTPKGT